ncbi:MAG: Ig-like domain-containing protein, partial [Planctomycetota bacterium]|nr:Ig-like domain-containing protein [Planctomycetota bacterium]
MLDTPTDPNWSGRLELDNGLLLRDWDGGYMYYPDPNNTIGDSLTYTVFDTGDSGALGGALSSTATVTIAVTDRNTPPVCVNDYDPHLVGLVTAEDVTLTTIDVTPLLANDTDMDSPALDPTSFVVVTEPSRGTLTNHEDGTITYVPDPNVYGWDEFTYKVSDTGYDGSDGDGNPMPPAEADEPGTVYVYIDEVNDAPEANDDFYTVGKVSESLAESYTLDPLENDTGGPGEENSGAPDRSTIVIESDVTNGTLSAPDPVSGIVVYTPSDDFFGIDSFTYSFTEQDTDPTDGVPPLGSNVATVTIEVRDRNTPPVAVDDSYAATEDITAFLTPFVWENDRDPETVANNGSIWECTELAATNGLDAATVKIVRVPEHGAILNMDPSSGVILDPNGLIEYQPGLDQSTDVTFDYVIADCHDAVSAPATVTIDITAVNDPPVGEDGFAQVNENGCGPVDSDNTYSGDLALLSSDVDSVLDGSAVWTLVTDVAFMSGGLLFNSDGTFTYTPDALPTHGVAEDSFTWTVTDPEGDTSGEATFTITVVRNSPPVAVGESFEGDEDSSPLIRTWAELLVNDHDEDGPALDEADIIVVDQPDTGYLVDNLDGTWSYHFDMDWCGSTQFTYRVLDDDCASSEPATVALDIDPLNDPPVLEDDAFLVPQWAPEPVVLDVLANDWDPDNDGGCGYPAPPWRNLRLVDGTDPSGSPGVRSVHVVDDMIVVEPEPCEVTADITVSFEYLADDSGGLSAATSGTVTLTLVFEDACPLVFDDSAVVDADV